jgi:hypothetical protein
MTNPSNVSLNSEITLNGNGIMIEVTFCVVAIKQVFLCDTSHFKQNICES